MKTILLKTTGCSGILLLFSALAAFAQVGYLKGVVSDAAGKPAPFVTIQLKELQKGTTSNEQGQFSLSAPSATYTLVASFVGFKTLEQRVKIEEGKTLNLALELVETAEQLKEIVVKGYLSANEKTVSLGKVAIRPMDLPQSIALVDRQTLDNQLALRMSDVLMNTNGVYIMGTTGGYQEEIAGRGFAFNSSNTFKNGVRYFNGMISELSSVERVEVMKGSSAILFGNVAAGGILNLVTKKPQFGFGGEVDLRVGSFGLLKPSFDVYGGIGKSQRVAFRVNGSYEQANSFRENVSSKRYYVNPSLLLKLGNKTELLLEADYLNDRRTPDFGVGIVNYQLVDVPRERFLGVTWGYYQAEQQSATATLTHRLSEQWKISATGAYRSYSTDLFSNTRPNTGALITADGTWIRNIQRSEVSENYYLGQVDLTGKFNTGQIQHTFLLGADTDQFTTLTDAYTQLARYDTLNIFGNKTYQIRTDVPTLSKNTLTTSPVSRFGVYVQDLISINQYIKLLAGIRYTYQQTGSDVYTYATDKTTSSVTYGDAFTPRLGLVIQPNRNHSFFASYANSFTLNTGVDVSGNALPPSMINQYELGVKNELLKGLLSVNVTAYRIINSNLAQISLANGNTNSNIRELAGEVQSEGLELDVAGRPLPSLSVRAGYSYNETKYIKSNTFIEGSLLLYNPKHTANASVFYSVPNGLLKGLRVGLTSLYFGTRYAGRLTRVQIANDAYRPTELPAYTQVDASASYTIKQLTLRAKVGNIFNALSYNVHDDNSVNPIAPTNVQLNVCLKFK
ncbi:MAG: TonB-dependent receptor [Spirosomataceae bacterium]